MKQKGIADLQKMKERVLIVDDSATAANIVVTILSERIVSKIL